MYTRQLGQTPSAVPPLPPGTSLAKTLEYQALVKSLTIAGMPPAMADLTARSQLHITAPAAPAPKGPRGGGTLFGIPTAYLMYGGIALGGVLLWSMARPRST